MNYSAIEIQEIVETLCQGAGVSLPIGVNYGWFHEFVEFDGVDLDFGISTPEGVDDLETVCVQESSRIALTRAILEIMTTPPSEDRITWSELPAIIREQYTPEGEMC